MKVQDLWLADNIAEGIHSVRCKDCDCFVECESANDNIINYECLYCKKIYSNKIDKEWSEWKKFSNNDINKFIVL